MPCDHPFSMCFQAVKKEDTRKEAVLSNIHACFFDLIQNGTRVHNDTQRPMKALVDGDEHKFHGKNVNISIGSPRRYFLGALLFKLGEEQRREEMHNAAKTWFLA